MAGRAAEEAVAAAVCFRHLGEVVQFLIVRTSGGGKWTFPKGRIEPDESPARAAQREAREEAGAEGRIETEPFIRYRYPRWPEGEYLVPAFLLHVSDRAELAPSEQGRDPRWLSPAETALRLAENRTSWEAAEHRKVVEAALARVRGSPG